MTPVYARTLNITSSQTPNNKTVDYVHAVEFPGTAPPPYTHIYFIFFITHITLFPLI